MKKHLFTILTITVIFSEIACTNNDRGPERRNVGKYLIDAVFVDSNTIDGIAKYYDNYNNLVSIVNYKNGLKDGYATNYYPKHGLKDSTIFSSGLKNGFTYYYDTTGRISSKQFNFYGCKAGDNIFYTSNKLYKYFFTDLNKNILVRCEYDPLGKCKIIFFASEPIVKVFEDSIDSVQNFLIYFPKPPNLSVIVTMGLINDKKETRDEVQLNDARLFLDTSVALAPNGWHYFVSRRVESAKDSINKLYIDEYK